MNNRTGLVLQSLVVTASVAYSGYMAGHLPSVVPTHWGLSGKPDQYGSPASILWLMPGAQALILVLTLALPALSPKRYEVTRFARTYAYTMLLVNVMMAAIHFVIVNAAAGAKFDIGRTLVTLLFGFFMLVGNLMGKVKQNFFVGVRTPWTLADGRVWDATHREAGHVWVIGGLIGAFLGLAGVPLLVLFPFFFALTLAPAVRSYVWYRRIVVRGTEKLG